MSKASMQEIKEFKAGLIQTALDLAADRNWMDVTMYDIARTADIELETATILFPEKIDILIAINRKIDDDLSGDFKGEPDANELPRDILFDIMMERFDLMNDNRAAFVSILNAVTLNPKASILSLPFLYHSLSHMMELSGMETDGIKGSIKIMALSGLFLKILRDWVKDDSPDLAATMASVDKSLNLLERIE